MLGARRVERIQSLADELIASGGKALAVPTDVTDYDQVQRRDRGTQEIGVRQPGSKANSRAPTFILNIDIYDILKHLSLARR